jgi:hypothetical protein
MGMLPTPNLFFTFHQELKIFEPKKQTVPGRDFSGVLLIFAAMWFAFYFFHFRTQTASTMPAAETAFANTLLKARSAWEAAPNSVAQAPMQTARTNAICGGKSQLAATNWTGTVQNIETDKVPDKNGKMAATIWIAVTPHVTLMTPRSSATADPDKLVEAGSPIYKIAGTLKNGAAVKFSGTFVPTLPHCLTTTSLTANGSMTDPYFEIHLSKLTEAGR